MGGFLWYCSDVGLASRCLAHVFICVSFIDYFTGEFFDDVFKGDDSVYSAELVSYDGKVLATFLENWKDVVCFIAVKNFYR